MASAGSSVRKKFGKKWYRAGRAYYVLVLSVPSVIPFHVVKSQTRVYQDDA